MRDDNFRKCLAEGIPPVLPPVKPFDNTINHAPKRKDILTPEEKTIRIGSRISEVK